MNEPRIEDYIDLPPAALVLPRESSATLALFDEEKRCSLAHCRARDFSGSSDETVERALEAVWPRYMAAWLFDETVLARDLLSRHLSEARFGALCLSPN